MIRFEAMEKIQVAIIEDHDLTRAGLRTAFSRHPHLEVVGEAIDGEAGLMLLQQKKPHVAIVDIGLPKMDGIELTRRFREWCGKTTTKPHPTRILVLTLEDNETSVLAAFAAGADSYCMKDIRFSALLEAIATTHQGHNWIDPLIAKVVLSKITPGMAQEAEPGTTEGESLRLGHSLTEREMEVLGLIVEGCSNADIADRLYITVGTVKTHVRNILNKLCADDRTQAAVKALRSGLIS